MPSQPLLRPEDQAGRCILAVNRGSSSLKFALYTLDSDPPLRRLLSGKVDRIGRPDALMEVKDLVRGEQIARPLQVAGHGEAALSLIDWLDQQMGFACVRAVGHRLVHGGSEYWQPTRISSELVANLQAISPFNPEHLPTEIALIEAFAQRHPALPQVACFDTAFHHELPRVARILPIPRSLQRKGVQRYGFHGLSCSFLMEELARLAGNEAAQGRVILAHFGAGASLTAVRGGKSVDTSMGFTPTGGIPMGTRSGDLDPGLVWFLARTEQMTPEQFQEMVNRRSGMLGVSETSSDMRDLLARQHDDVRAAEAVAMFCYQAKKWIGAFTAALGGLETLVFSAGIGENTPSVRAQICAGLGFLGLELDEARNAANAPVISSDHSRVTVCVIHTDEELMIARATCRALET